ncbi:MAG: WhiB family transcriptional regulator [Dermatophilus congolensis]|nr:WhiB family transcriptional regulator [Dermatophilus congolensis]
MSTHDSNWMRRAACASRLDLPWTSDAADVTPWQAATMRSICDRCPVLFACLDAVDVLDVTGGWWAGTDRDSHAGTAHLEPPAWATDKPPATDGPAAAVPAADEVPAAGEPMLCWLPRSRRGRVFEQGAYVLQRDDAGAWHLGGVA